MLELPGQLKEAARLAVLRSYEILDSEDEPSFDRITNQIARLLKVPYAMVTLLDQGRQWFKSCYGTTMRETSLALAFCTHTIEQDEVMMVEDARSDLRFCDNPLVTGAMGIRFYAGAPLTTPSGVKIGSLCVVDVVPRTLSEIDQRLLKDFAGIVVDALELRRLRKRLDKELAAKTPAKSEVGRPELLLEKRTKELAASNEALKEAESRYRGMFEDSVFGFFQTTLAGRYLSANNELARLYGYQSPAALIEHLREIDHQLYIDRNRRAEFLRSMLEDGKVTAFQSMIRRRDGSVIWIAETARAVVNDAGEILYFEGIVEDITRQKANEEELRRSCEVLENKMRSGEQELERSNANLSFKVRESQVFSAAIRSSVVGVLITDPSKPDNPTVLVNPAFERITGYTQSEVIGKNCRFLQGDESSLEMIAEMRRAQAERRPFRGLILNYRKGGIPFWNELSIDPVFDEAGELIHFIGLQNDVTSRVEAELALGRSEARKTAILEASLDAVITIDQEGRVVETNPATSRIFGYKEEEMLGRQMSDLIVPPHLREAHATGMDRYLATGEGPILGTRLEMPAMKADGSIIPIELAITRIRGEGAAMFTGHIRDITARRQSEAALRKAKDEAERANAAKSDFLSRMSHELRTPLNAILGFSQLLQRRPLEAEMAEYMGYISKAGMHLLDLVNDVLDLAKIESGRIDLSLQPIQIAEVMHESLEMVQTLAAERDVQLVLDSSLATSPQVLADRRRIKQVCVNLLTNGVKYNRSGGTLTVRSLPPDNGCAAIEFIDTGLGITSDAIDRLFVPFERLDAEQSAVEGSGIGLAITRRLVTMMGGSVDVRSVPGEGSTFSVKLPVTKVPTGKSSGSSIEEAEALAACKQTILYIESQPENLALLQEAVTQRDDVLLLPTTFGGQARALALAHSPQAIILDLQVSEPSGEEVFEQLRGDPKLRNIPIFITSFDAPANQVSRLLRLGACGFISKPIDLDPMLQLLEEHLGTAP